MIRSKSSKWNLIKNLNVFLSFFRQTSWSEYTFYASGRKNCFYSLYKLEMDKRHCVFSRFVLGFMQPTQDILTVDIPILFPGGDYGGPPPYPIEFFLT